MDEVVFHSSSVGTTEHRTDRTPVLTAPDVSGKRRERERERECMTEWWEGGLEISLLTTHLFTAYMFIHFMIQWSKCQSREEVGGGVCYFEKLLNLIINAIELKNKISSCSWLFSIVHSIVILILNLKSISEII